MAATLVSKNRSFQGHQFVYKHPSSTTNCEMTFGVYIPDHQPEEKLPTLFYLSGLTCTHANFMEKSGFQQFASKHRFIVVHPDTSPRGVDIAGDSDSWDFGKGAGFYVNATVEKWSKNYRMYDYIVKELLEEVAPKVAPIDAGRVGIFGHSMGGHGALTIGLRNPQKFKSISAFAPICNPISVPWGQKALGGYLGEDQATWKEYDASEVLKRYEGPKREILVDQGTADNFLGQLKPETLKETDHVAVEVRMQKDFDHSYYFIASFMADHFAHHAKALV
uniref:S-formylglutathione hydrolase n=1 Tax=Caenorhabditis tropicalis TaxID=1561998 RepID=A0A1I7UIC1_9PELO